MKVKEEWKSAKNMPLPKEIICPKCKKIMKWNKAHICIKKELQDEYKTKERRIWDEENEL